jgi:hypothetical protein
MIVLLLTSAGHSRKPSANGRKGSPPTTSPSKGKEIPVVFATPGNAYFLVVVNTFGTYFGEYLMFMTFTRLTSQKENKASAGVRTWPVNLLPC